MQNMIGLRNFGTQLFVSDMDTIGTGPEGLQEGDEIYLVRELRPACLA